MAINNQSRLITKCLLLSLIAVSVVSVKPTKIVPLEPVSNVRTDTSKDDEKERPGLEYQIENLLIIFLICIFMSSCILFWLDQHHFWILWYVVLI